MKIDNKENEIGFIHPNEFIIFNLKPGKYSIISDSKNKEFAPAVQDTDASLDIQLEAGETIYLEQSTSVYVVYVKNSLSMVDYTEGEATIKGLSEREIFKGKGKIGN